MFIFLTSFTSATLCFQDTANKSSSNDGTCTLNYSGTYNFNSSATWVNETALYDANTSTYTTGGSETQNALMLVNYSLPINLENSTSYHSITTLTGTYNTLIPQSCINWNNGNKLSIKIEDHTTAGTFCPPKPQPHTFANYIYSYCLNSTGWVTLYTESFECSSPNNNIYEDGVYWNILNTTAQNLVINNPTGLINSLINVPINITILNRNLLDRCIFNVTRGLAQTLEVPNTYINDCNFTVTNVSGYATYDFHVCINYTNSAKNCSDSTFFINTPVSSSSSGGGGGGGVIQDITDLLNKTRLSGEICEKNKPAVIDAWTNLTNDFSFEKLKIFIVAFWDYTTCKSSASIVPFSILSYRMPNK
jgi:hypothetical protein